MAGSLQRHLIAASWILATMPVLAAQPVLTGLLLQPVAADGTGSALFFSTNADDANANLFVTLWANDNTLQPLNGQPNQALTPSPLVDGKNRFYFSASFLGKPYGDFSISAFFDGDKNPGISVLAPTSTIGYDEFIRGPFNVTGPYAANSASTGFDLDGQYHANAGTLSFVTNGKRITVTAFKVFDGIDGYLRDSVGPFVQSPDGHSDYFGELDITVTSVPEPGLPSMFLAGFGCTLLLGRRKRKSGTQPARSAP